MHCMGMNTAGDGVDRLFEILQLSDFMQVFLDPAYLTDLFHLLYEFDYSLIICTYPSFYWQVFLKIQVLKW